MRLVSLRESDLDPSGDAMTTAIFSDGRSIGEAEFLAIGETPEHIELFDGSLHVSPGPTPRHQKVSRWLANALEAGANAVGLQVLAPLNVRLRPERISISEVVAVSTAVDLDELIIDAADVSLVSAILPPSNSATDNVLKMHYYAAAGIPWYLIADPVHGVFHLHRLVGGTYATYSVGKDGEVLQLTEPVVATLDLAELLTH